MKKIILLLFSLVLSILLGEIILAPYARVERKMYILGEHVDGTCYSSNPENYFPYDVRKDYNGEKYQNFLDYSKNISMGDTGSLFEYYKQYTPYCVIYDDSRLKGFNPEREHIYLLLGDSFTIGEGVKDEDSLGYILGELTNADFLNYGLSGANMNYVYNQSKHIFYVDGIIYFYNLNDVLRNPAVFDELKLVNDFQNVWWGKAELVEFSSILRLLQKIIIMQSSTHKMIEGYNKIYAGQNFEKSMDMVQEMSKDAASKNMTFQMVIYPLLHKGLFGSPFESIHKKIMDACMIRNISCIDGLPAFDDYLSMKQFHVHPVDYHPNGKANRLIVEYILDNGLVVS